MYKYVDKINDYIVQTGIKHTELADRIGISKSILSQYLSKTYKAPATTNIKIEEFFKRLEQADETPIVARKGLCFAKTSIASEVLNTIAYCQIQRKIGCIYGDAGIGKTMAIEQYARENSECIVITVTKATSRQRSFFGMLCDELHIPSGRIDTMYKACKRKLDQSEKVVIIDEAQHLPYTTLEDIRSLNDKNGIGIVLVGNYEVHEKLNRQGFAQLANRIGFPKLLLNVNIKRNDVQLIFNDLGDKEIDILYSIAKSEWCLRGAVHTYTNACMNEDVTADGLRGMARVMGILAV